MNTIKSSTKSKTFYAYKFKICGYGGKYTIGSISNEMASYWSKLGDDVLNNFISTDDKEEIIEKYNVPEKYHEELAWMNWTDFSDISDVCGPFIESGASEIEVYDGYKDSKNPICTIKITEDMIESREFPDEGKFFPNKQLIYGFELDKGDYDLKFGYEDLVEMEEPFDPKKLKISTSVWDAMGQRREILKEIQYGDEYVSIEESDVDNKERDGEVCLKL